MKRFSLFRRKLWPLQASGSLFLLALAFSAYPQIEKTLVFIPDHIDFGKIREDDGRVSHKVKAVNISSDTTFIISARTSCGCSAAEYPEHSFAPGDTVEVTLSYDPQNRPGKFLKTARFFTGEQRIANSIKLSGTVIPSRKNLDKAYPDSVGCLRLSTRFVNAGEISRTEARPLFVGIYNDSDNPIPFSVATDADALEGALLPDTIEPYGIATLTLMLKGRLIPSSLQEVNYQAYIMCDTDTLFSLPVFCRVRK